MNDHEPIRVTVPIDETLLAEWGEHRVVEELLPDIEARARDIAGTEDRRLTYRKWVCIERRVLPGMGHETTCVEAEWDTVPVDATG